MVECTWYMIVECSCYIASSISELYDIVLLLLKTDKMLNEENVYFVNGNSEIYVPEENDKDCTDDRDIQDERFNEENDNSEVHQIEENDKSCLIESDIQGESHNVGGESQLSNNFIGLNGSLV
ncbi:hypothetical protein L2E82_05844 [Cichorium intybus]|uniref:Uncharacterized protein n=1 Tax=Cichorium intybus TaxID=13427 RepID=A0ACB9H8Y1_CICIN|nr:hypothetical protein L2E82_05844 [Cichorium intybus]